MRRNLAAIALVLVLAFGSQAARAFVDPPVLVPPNPVVGQQVSISIRAGVCDLLLADPAPTITRTGNNIHMTVQSASSVDPSFCNYPIFTATIPVGTFEAGSYSLQVDRMYIGGGGPVTQTLGTLSFVIAAIATTPTLGTIGLIALALTMLIAFVVALRRRHAGLIVILLTVGFLPIAGRAQVPTLPPSLEVLLSSKPGAPTPDTVVSYFSTGRKGSIPLQSLLIENPQGAAYLLPIRAKGDFLANINAYPNWSRAQLERYVVVQFPQTANLQNAIAAFKSDPYVDAVYMPATSARFSSATLIGFGVSSSPPRDFILVSTTADIQQAHTDGFNLRTIQGYVYQTCSPEPTCIPTGAQKFYRECNTTLDDCATFLESERTTFESNGYTSAYPATSSKVLGYAYPNVDTDGDGLVDGMEYAIGTNPNLADSNGDGTSDGTAYPQAGVPVSDPCLGAGAINCPANFIFRNGFQ